MLFQLFVGNYERLIREGLPNLINRINWIAGVGTDSLDILIICSSISPAVIRRLSHI